MSFTIEKYLLKYFKNPTVKDIDLIKSRSTIKKYEKGETIINHGDFSESTFILATGYVANFTLLEDRSPFIRTIFKPLDEFGSLKCFITKQESNMVFKAITDCEVCELKLSDLLFTKNQVITKLYVKILEQTFLMFEKRISELAGYDATKRYKSIRKDIPNIDDILPQHQIANYLNVTAVQLSRIRKKLFS